MISPNTEWPEPTPLGPPDPPRIRTASWPRWMHRAVRTVASSTQTPPDMAALLALSAVATAVQAKGVVHVRPGYTEPLTIWTATVLPPGNRKSAVFAKMVGPIREYERDLRERVKPEHLAAMDRRDVLEGRLNEAKKAAKASDAGENERRAVRRAREELDRLHVPPLPTLVLDDVTQERMGQVLEENHGRASVLAPEGDFLRILDGRHSRGAPALGVVKRGWTGEPVRDDRVGRDGTDVQAAHVTMGITLQPSVLETLENRRSFTGEGVLDRFLYAMPPSPVGYRKSLFEAPSLDMAAMNAYGSHLRELLRLEPASVVDGTTWTPHELGLSEGARAVLGDLDRELERAKRSGGDLASVVGWGSKLTGQLIRVAGLLHVARAVEEGGEPWAAPISEVTMLTAAELAGPLSVHARHVLGRFEAPEEERAAMYVLDRLREPDMELPIPQAELYQRCKGKALFDSSDDLEEALHLLQDHDLVRLVPQASDGVGRPPKPLVEVHPSVTKHVPDIPETPNGEGFQNKKNMNPGLDDDETLQADLDDALGDAA